MENLHDVIYGWSLGPVHVLDRVDLGQEELFRQLVAAVHLDLGRGEWNTHQTDVSSQQRSHLVLCDKTDCAVGFVDCCLSYFLGLPLGSRAGTPKELSKNSTQKPTV